MAFLELEQIDKSFGATRVLRDLNLEISEGEFTVLVGPSGCGKSTLLNLVAGLDTIDQGRIRIRGVEMNHVPPARRNIAMVFQSYALYPHLNVRRNMSFALEMQGKPRAERDAAVARVAAQLQLTDLLDRKPVKLSGGQRQRVAIGRALVRNPDVFLFDEPLSNLDAKLRVEMRTLIKRLHQELGTTTLYVTHDQVEAMSLADRIAVMHQGVLQQTGTPAEIYNRPANLFVAGFMGSPPMNLLRVKIAMREERLAACFTLGNGETAALTIKDETAALRALLDREVIMGLRPEAIGDAAHLPGQGFLPVLENLVEVVEPTGADTYLVTRMAGVEVLARARSTTLAQPGKPLRFSVDMSSALFFDPKSGRLIG
jgi:multiple sugar transport system ATP-binding protein